MAEYRACCRMTARLGVISAAGTSTGAGITTKPPQMPDALEDSAITAAAGTTPTTTCW